MALSAYSYLAKGMQGEGVIELQNDLWSLGFDITSDGAYGNETVQAVKNFQYTWGSLTIDGIVGAQTAAAIKQAIDMLNVGQWDPNNDPLQAPAQIQSSASPQPPRVPSTTITTGAEPSSTLSSLSSLPIIGPLMPNIDWKWIGMGALAVVGIFYYMNRRQS